MDNVIPEGVFAVDAPTAARRLGLSPSTIWKLAYAGEIRTKKVGRRRLFPVAALDEFLARGDA